MNQEHVIPLLNAYILHQLTERQRARVRNHLRFCGECRLALSHQEELVSDLRHVMPSLGTPDPDQLRNLWFNVRTEISMGQPTFRLSPSFGVLIMVVIMGTFGLSAIFGNPSQVVAESFPQVPADVRATNTPFHTDEPNGEAAAPVLPSQTASALTLPQPSPAPPAAFTIRRTR